MRRDIWNFGSGEKKLGCVRLDGRELNGVKKWYVENGRGKGMGMVGREFESWWNKVGKGGLYVRCGGIYEMYVNGEGVGEEYFNGGVREYNKRDVYEV